MLLESVNLRDGFLLKFKKGKIYFKADKGT